MAIRILLVIFSFVLVVNLVLMLVGLFMGVNLYEKYGKQILNFFIIAALIIVATLVVLAIMGIL